MPDGRCWRQRREPSGISLETQSKTGGLAPCREQTTLRLLAKEGAGDRLRHCSGERHHSLADSFGDYPQLCRRVRKGIVVIGPFKRVLVGLIELNVDLFLGSALNRGVL